MGASESKTEDIDVDVDVADAPADNHFGHVPIIERCPVPLTVRGTQTLVSC